jgi:hypothetical protein
MKNRKTEKPPTSDDETPGGDPEKRQRIEEGDIVEDTCYCKKAICDCVAGIATSLGVQETLTPPHVQNAPSVPLVPVVAQPQAGTQGGGDQGVQRRWHINQAAALANETALRSVSQGVQTMPATVIINGEDDQIPQHQMAPNLLLAQPQSLPIQHAVNQNIPLPAVPGDRTILEHCGTIENPPYNSQAPHLDEPFNAHRLWFYPEYARIQRNGQLIPIFRANMLLVDLFDTRIRGRWEAMGEFRRVTYIR